MTTLQRPKDWKNYDDFAAGIDTNRLPNSPALAGKSFHLDFEDGRALDLVFSAADTLAWSEGGSAGAEAADVVEVDDGVFFVDIAFTGLPTEAETFILDTLNRRVLAVRCIVRAPEAAPGEPRVAQVFRTGVIAGGAPKGLPAADTRDLVGLTAHYTYSPNHVYEHVYLSTKRYCWQCLRGVQRGHGDVDMTTTMKFGDNLYVFAFREFKIAVASFFFYNFKTMRSTGKFLGVTGDGRIVNNRAGALIEKRGQTLYPAGLEPI